MLDLMWVIFSGTEEAPVVNRFIFKREDLRLIQLQDNEWVEEFEISKRNNDREVCTSECR